MKMPMYAEKISNEKISMKYCLEFLEGFRNSYHVIIPGSIRSKKNSKRIFARGNYKQVLPSKAYEDWNMGVKISVTRRNELLSCCLGVEAHFYYKGPEPDLSGCLESIGDALEGIIWENDRQIVSWDGSRKHHDKDNPRTEIFVRW